MVLILAPFFSQREPSKRGHKSPDEYYRAQGYPDPEVGQYLYLVIYIINSGQTAKSQ
jgi:hypothetical protein